MQLETDWGTDHIRIRLIKLIDPIVALTSNGMCRNDSDGKKDTYSVRIHESFSRSFWLRLPLIWLNWPLMTASAASDDSIHFSRFLAFGLQISLLASQVGKH